MSRLATLSEEPIDEDGEYKHHQSHSPWYSSSGKRSHKTWRNWLKTHLSLLPNKHKSINDLNILLSVLGCPLFPVSFLPPTPKSSSSQVSSSAQYIIQHFTAATGCRKLEGTVRNMYATGKVNMAMVDELNSNALTAISNVRVSQRGCFVMWQMVPNKWLIELVVGGHKVVAGSDGNVAWRHTPWLGSHAAKGGVRPLRRALQGLDPMAVAGVFSQAQYMGEKRIGDVDCFVLKLSADDADLAERSDNTAEMIKHVMFGYFSQRNGLLVHLEDSYLTRVQAPGSFPMYWETYMATKIEDYRIIEGVMIAHSGQSDVIITRFGDNLRAGPVITRMEEKWTIDDLAFNVPGLSMDCFIPPEELHKDSTEENLD
ncbi:uncharacterized protein LOC112501501 [Cynara cardunculus var. scolymus]|uniref:Uncharacterized protein n=1 Tax=Cynara cardunculus var. scolymus TaxID=59895 RepID=A0A103YG43_CYNCS|nr:uncharacterized protein LOC112501501 [Cynara cardunculus var. scolymus]KVI08425.1 hypothetical protein Ccrd_013212 [Cynara cardunculus var. scolymus]